MSLLGKEDTYIYVANQLYKERKLRGPMSPLEKELWMAAMAAPFGGIVIGREGDPYLLRAYLLPERLDGSPMPGAYLHYFVRGDTDPNPHNHPWDTASSLILTGGYKEHRLTHDRSGYEIRTFGPGSHNQIECHTYHKVELLNPEEGCWTLFTAGQRLSPSDGYDWGFFDMEQKKHVPWKEYGSTSDQEPT